MCVRACLRDVAGPTRGPHGQRARTAAPAPLVVRSTHARGSAAAEPRSPGHTRFCSRPGHGAGPAASGAPGPRPLPPRDVRSLGPHAGSPRPPRTDTVAQPRTVSCVVRCPTSSRSRANMGCRRKWPWFRNTLCNPIFRGDGDGVGESHKSYRIVSRWRHRPSSRTSRRNGPAASRTRRAGGWRWR